MACIPIICGLPTKLSQEGTPGENRICPRCHNASVNTWASRKWFELYWIPLIPFPKKHIWLCHICQWKTPVVGPDQPGGGPSSEPAKVGQQQQSFAQGQQQQYGQQQQQPQGQYVMQPPPRHGQGGYDVGYSGGGAGGKVV